jgi:uncharacterized protein
MPPLRCVFATLVLSILPIWMTGCAGTSAPARLYVLTPAPEAAAESPVIGAACNLGLGVGPIRLPALLDSPQIVTRRGADEIERAEFDRWAEPLADTIPRVLAENLAALWKTDRIVMFPWDPAQSVQYQVVVTVMRFDGVMGGDVVLDAGWRILASDGKELMVNRSVLTQSTTRTGYLAMVMAMSRALMAFSHKITVELAKLPRAEAEGCSEHTESGTRSAERHTGGVLWPHK